MGRLLRANQPGPHLHALRVPAHPGDAGKQACRTRRASPSELRDIESAAQTCGHGHVNGDNAQFNEGDEVFHLGIATASHNVFLVSAVREARSLQVQASVIGLHGLGGHAAAAVEEHAAIYRAIRDGEPEAAAEATSVHLDNTLEDYRREIQRRVLG